MPQTETTRDRCVFCDAPIREQQSLAVHLETCEAVP